MHLRLTQFFPSEASESAKFKSIVDNRMSSRYFPSHKVGEMVRLSGRALSKITSSFMVLTNDGHKNNLGLSLKFEGKGLKVIDYSRKNDRFWEFSEKAVDLIREYKVCTRSLDICMRNLCSSSVSGKVSRGHAGP